MNLPAMTLTVAIPTYRREAVLIDTIASLRSLRPPPDEILVIDQTEQHEAQTDAALRRWHDEGAIRWARLDAPSIPRAMNEALVMARHDIVLFVDDDIVAEPALVRAHTDAHSRGAAALVAGRVIQPWQEGAVLADEPFHFASSKRAWITQFMGGNFSISRSLAMELGGFDENFVSVAYRFEAEFAHRWRAAGHRILFEPAACLHHLKAGSGGTRTYGEHLTTWRPDHAVGAYYYSLRTGSFSEFLRRPLQSVATRFHLRHPWRIPATLTAELRGMLWALRLFARGARTLQIRGQGRLGGSP
jgi:GT2 family glycosyltransferase